MQTTWVNQVEDKIAKKNKDTKIHVVDPNIEKNSKTNFEQISTIVKIMRIQYIPWPTLEKYNYCQQDNKNEILLIYKSGNRIRQTSTKTIVESVKHISIIQNLDQCVWELICRMYV